MCCCIVSPNLLLCSFFHSFSSFVVACLFLFYSYSPNILTLSLSAAVAADCSCAARSHTHKQRCCAAHSIKHKICIRVRECLYEGTTRICRRYIDIRSKYSTHAEHTFTRIENICACMRGERASNTHRVTTRLNQFLLISWKRTAKRVRRVLFELAKVLTTNLFLTNHPNITKIFFYINEIIEFLIFNKFEFCVYKN